MIAYAGETQGAKLGTSPLANRAPWTEYNVVCSHLQCDQNFYNALGEETQANPEQFKDPQQALVQCANCRTT